MGFSVSGSFAVIAIGTFIAVGMFYGAASNGAERVTESQADTFDERIEQQNTEINVTLAEWDTTITTDTLTIEVKNKGSSALHVNGTDYIIDNEYVDHASVTVENVDGDSTTNLWLPGETLHVEIEDGLLQDQDISSPDRVKIVTETGVSDFRKVTDI